MARKKRSKRERRLKERIRPGAPPGTLTIDPRSNKPIIRVFAFGPDQFVEQTIADVQQLRQFVGQWPVTWVNIDGLGDLKVLTEIGAMFGMHKLALEDVLNVEQRPKVEIYEDKLFIVARMADDSTGDLRTEQISLFVGKDFVLSFQESYGDCLDDIRQRIRSHGGRIRDAGADYCGYCLLDALVDHYFPILERYGERMEQLEDQILQSTNPQVVTMLFDIRRDLIELRRAMWPLREAISILLRESTPVITPTTRIYLRDCYDHTVQIVELTESYRELLTGLMDMYRTGISNQYNEVIKVLTIISTIFIPLTFIVGIYGMNFQNMPELQTRWGYFVVMLFMACLASAMLFFFYRKGWLSSLDARRKKAPAPCNDHRPVEVSRHPLTQGTANLAGPRQPSAAPVSPAAPAAPATPPRLPGTRKPTPAAPR